MRYTTLYLTITLTLVLPTAVLAQASLEGPTGVFLTPLAYTLPEGTVQGSMHFADLQPLGTLTTLGVTAGLPGGFEVGLTRAAFAVGGTNNTDVLHAKWAALPEKHRAPAVSIGAILRRTHGGDSTADLYLVATKVFPTKTPVIVSANVRSTNGIGFGLLGKSDREMEIGGFLGFVVNPRLIVGWEAARQPGAAPTWSDFCFRYSPTPDTNIDGGLADLGPGLDDQVAVAFTRRF